MPVKEMVEQKEKNRLSFRFWQSPSALSRDPLLGDFEFFFSKGFYGDSLQGRHSVPVEWHIPMKTAISFQFWQLSQAAVISSGHPSLLNCEKSIPIS